MVDFDTSECEKTMAFAIKILLNLLSRCVVKLPRRPLPDELRFSVSKQLCGLLLDILYTGDERQVLQDAVGVVAGNTTITIMEPQARRGRECRRDEAAFQAYSKTGMKQARLHFGLELSYWILKHHVPDPPRRHHQQIGIEE